MSFSVTASGQLEDIPAFKFDSDVKKIYGLQLNSNYADRLFHRGSLRLEIDGKEILPFGENGYPAKSLISNLSVPTEKRFNKWIFGENGISAGNQTVKVRFKDTNHPNASFTTYKVDLLFLVEI